MWESVPKSERTISHLTSRLLIKEETNRRYGIGEADFGISAFSSYHATYGQRFQGRGGRPTRGFRGSHHGEYRGGHSSYQSHYEASNKRQKFHFDYCFRDNHVQDNCRVRQRHEKERGILNTNQNNQKEKTSFSFTVSNQITPNVETSQNEKKPTCSTASNLNPLKWYADSGATQHLTDQFLSLNNFVAIEPGLWMVSGIGESCLSVYGQGDVDIITKVNGLPLSAIFEKVLYVPGLGTNLF